jgi:hypothetical protein
VAPIRRGGLFVSATATSTYQARPGLGSAYPSDGRTRATPGYGIDPLRGSRMDRCEVVLGAQKAGKAPSGPLGLDCPIEASNSPSFWSASETNRGSLLTGNLPNFFVARPAAPERQELGFGGAGTAVSNSRLQVQLTGSFASREKPTPQRQPHIPKLDGARRHRCLLQSRIVLTRPPPSLPRDGRSGSELCSAAVIGRRLA